MSHAISCLGNVSALVHARMPSTHLTLQGSPTTKTCLWLYIHTLHPPAFSPFNNLQLSKSGLIEWICKCQWKWVQLNTQGIKRIDPHPQHFWKQKMKRAPLPRFRCQMQAGVATKETWGEKSYLTVLPMQSQVLVLQLK